MIEAIHTLNWWQFVLLLWAAMTVFWGVVQFWENRIGAPDSRYRTPVWWIMLTWPIWLVVIAADIPWGPHHPWRQKVVSRRFIRPPTGITRADIEFATNYDFRAVLAQTEMPDPANSADQLQQEHDPDDRHDHNGDDTDRLR